MTKYLPYLLVLFIVLQGLHLLAQPILGTFNRVPNGSFEALAIAPAVGGGLLTDPYWNLGYARYLSYWRQFNRLYLDDRGPGLYGQLPIEADRLYGDRFLPYDPVACSSPDLLSNTLIVCEFASATNGAYSPVAIPINTFGMRTLSLPSAQNQRYAGLYARHNTFNGGTTPPLPVTEFWREYLQTELLKPLEQGVTYTFSMKVALAQISRRAGQVAARVSTEPFTNSGLIDCNTVLEGGPSSRTAIPVTTGQSATIVTANLPDVTQDWVTVTTTYQAIGGEKYLVLGDFRELNPSQIELLQPDLDCGAYHNDVSSHARASYVYIDDVRLDETIECECGPDICVFVDYEATEVSNNQCCYRVFIVNGHYEGDDSERRPLCDIGQLQIYDQSTDDLLFTWTAASAEQGIPADNQMRYVGTMCVPTFSRSVVREFRAVSGTFTTPGLCQEQGFILGCGEQSECHCATEPPSSTTFTTSKTRVVRVPGTHPDDCCWAVYGNFSNLPCNAAEVRFFSSQYPDADKEVPGSRHQLQLPYPNADNTLIHTICNPVALPTGQLALSMGIYDANGNLLCFTVISKDQRCDCVCNSNRLQTGNTPWVTLNKLSESEEGCCYEVAVVGVNNCRTRFTSVSLTTKAAVASATPGSGFAATTVTTGGSSVVTFTSSLSRDIFPGESTVLGVVCVEGCSESTQESLQAMLVQEGTPACTTTIGQVPRPTCNVVDVCESLQLSWSAGATGQQASVLDCFCIGTLLVNATFCSQTTKLRVRVSGQGWSNEQPYTPNIQLPGGPTRFHRSMTLMIPKGGQSTYLVEILNEQGEVLCSATHTQACPGPPCQSPPSLRDSPMNHPNIEGERP